MRCLRLLRHRVAVVQFVPVHLPAGDDIADFVHNADAGDGSVGGMAGKTGQQAGVAEGGNQAIGRTKGGPNTKLHLAVDAHEMPVNLRVTAGTAADCTQAAALRDGIPFDATSAEYLLADRGCDTDKLLAAARERRMMPVIPPQRNQKVAQEYDAALYQARHLAANSFGKLQE